MPFTCLSLVFKHQFIFIEWYSFTKVFCIKLFFTSCLISYDVNDTNAANIKDGYLDFVQ